MRNYEFTHLLPAGFDNSSKVWIYQSNRLFSLPEALKAEELLNSFTATWTSHGDVVKGYANLFFGQFIVMMADEKATGVSGCSTDSSVHLIKQIERSCNVNLFDRQLLAFIIKEKVQLLPLSQLQYAWENEFINADTPYFNNLVQTKEELERNWIMPVKQSWLAGRIRVVNPQA